MARDTRVNMNKNIIIAAGIAFILLIGIFGGPLFDILGDGEYHTGFDWSDINNGETKSIKCGCGAYETGCWYGNIDPDYTELIRIPMNNNPVVTEMKDTLGGDSVPISIYGSISQSTDTIPRYWSPDYGWYKVEIIYNPGGTPVEIINTKDNRVNQEIATIVSGTTTKQRYSEVVEDGLYTDTIDPIEFKIKGRHVGILKVTQMTEFEALFGTQHMTQASSVDYSFLISGFGTVQIVNDVGRYLEGETIQFEVNTGYSGSTQGGEWQNDGWQLEIRDSSGSVRKTWNIADDQMGGRKDKQGNDLKYTIPADCWNDDGSNKWTVVLTNRLFVQDYKTYFTISKEEAAKAPEMKSITYDKDKYNLGDHVNITFTGEPNYEGTGDVHGFFVQIRYGTSGAIFYPGYEGTYITTNSGNSRTINIRPAKGDISMVVEAWAFDDYEYEGGRMSEKMTSSFWVEDEDRSQVGNFWLIVICIAIVTFFALIALLVPMPTGLRALLLIMGVAGAILYWAYSTGMLEGII